MAEDKDVKEMLMAYLKELHLPAMRASYEELARQAQQEGMSYEQYLLGLVQRECQERRTQAGRAVAAAIRGCRWRRVWQSLDLKRLPAKVVQQARTLLEGSFVDRHENVLAFGQPGSGKTHLLVRDWAGVGAGRSAGAVRDVQPAGAGTAGGQAGPEDCSRVLKQLAAYAALIVDDLGYVQQSREEMEVLFTLLGGAVRAGQRAADEQPAVLGVGGDLQGPDDDGGGHRPPGASQRDPGVERAQLPGGAGQEGQAESGSGGCGGRRR